jgi:esterase/lipase superfamily enzyme
MVRWRTSNSLRDTAVQDQHALLLFALHRHKAHVRPRHRLADSLRIGRVVLAALEVGLDVARRHQPDLMAKRRQFRGPMVRGRTGLDADQAWRKVSEELQQLGPPQLPSNNNRADGVDTVNLKHSLRDIQTDRGNLHGGRFLSLWRSATTTLWHIDAGEQGPPTPSSSSAVARQFFLSYFTARYARSD